MSSSNKGERRPDNPMGFLCLFVACIANVVNEDDLRKLFGDYGQIEHIQMVQKRDKRKQMLEKVQVRGLQQAFITFADSRSPVLAIEELRGKDMPLFVPGDYPACFELKMCFGEGQKFFDRDIYQRRCSTEGQCANWRLGMKCSRFCPLDHDVKNRDVDLMRDDNCVTYAYGGQI